MMKSSCVPSHPHGMRRRSPALRSSPSQASSQSPWRSRDDFVCRHTEPVMAASFLVAGIVIVAPAGIDVAGRGPFERWRSDSSQSRLSPSPSRSRAPPTGRFMPSCPTSRCSDPVVPFLVRGAAGVPHEFRPTGPARGAADVRSDAVHRRHRGRRDHARRRPSAPAASAGTFALLGARRGDLRRAGVVDAEQRSRARFAGAAAIAAATFGSAPRGPPAPHSGAGWIAVAFAITPPALAASSCSCPTTPGGCESTAPRSRGPC